MGSRRKILAALIALTLAVLATMPVAPVWCIAADHARVEAAPAVCGAAPVTGAAVHAHGEAASLHAGGVLCTDVSLATAASTVAVAAVPPPAAGAAAPVTPEGTPAAPQPPPGDTRAVPLGTTCLLI